MNKYLYILKTSITGLNLFERLLLAAILCLTVIGFVMKQSGGQYSSAEVVEATRKLIESRF